MYFLEWSLEAALLFPEPAWHWGCPASCWEKHSGWRECLWFRSGMYSEWKSCRSYYPC